MPDVSPEMLETLFRVLSLSLSILTVTLLIDVMRKVRALNARQDKFLISLTLQVRAISRRLDRWQKD